MLNCSICGFNNAPGALVCAQCYSLLRTVRVTQLDSTARQAQSKTDEKQTPARHPLRDVGILGPNMVALFMDNKADPLLLQISQQAILGRYTADAALQPRVDLTPYGAFEKGISRMHCTIRRVADGLTIEDLKSSNGTWLNGQRLPAYQSSAIRSGDCLKLGQLILEIFYR
jgi:hypothetical protein